MTWRIPLCRPVIGRAEEQAVLRVLRSGNLANGPLADKFAGQVAKRHGLACGVAVSSGTLGLELSLRALGVGYGDRVACPAYTFVASANAILAVGARPVFYDVDDQGLMTTKGVDTETKVAVVVDLFGASARHVGLFFHRRGIPVIEDACEAIGNNSVGYGDLVVFGFFPNKQITTGEGGVVCGGAESTLRDRVFRMRNHGRWPYPDEQHLVGWGTNARMSEIHAAIGLEQMKRLDRLLWLRRRVANWYLDTLPYQDVRAIPDGRMSWFVFPVWFHEKSIRDRVRKALTAAKIQSGDYFPYIPTLPQFGSKFTLPEYPVAKRLADTGLALPFFPAMTKDEVREVVKVVRAAMR